MHIHHTALIVSDYARSKRFYTEILDLQILAEHYRAARDSWKLDLGLNGQYVVELFSFPNPPPRPGSMDGTPEALGVACEPIRIDEYTGKQLFFIKDPDGLPLEFYQQ